MADKTAGDPVSVMTTALAGLSGTFVSNDPGLSEISVQLGDYRVVRQLTNATQAGDAPKTRYGYGDVFTFFRGSGAKKSDISGFAAVVGDDLSGLSAVTVKDPVANK